MKKKENLGISEEELDKQIKKLNKEEKNQLFFCPICGSTSLKPIIYGFSKDSVAISPEMKCIDCNFKGFMLSATPDELVEYQKKLAEKKK